MLLKNNEKEKAIILRKKGFSYSEILDIVPVAKSTLSLWLKSVRLSHSQTQRLTEKKLAAIRRGGVARKMARISVTKSIKDKAIKQIGKISKRELWLIGVALYWGEGHKERKTGILASLGNSDPYLIKLYLKWLLEVVGVPREDINFWIFLHDNSSDRLDIIQKYWSDITGFPLECFQKVTWKKNKYNPRRNNQREDYYGLLRVVVRKSVNLTRKIEGWIDGIYKYCGVV